MSITDLRRARRRLPAALALATACTAAPAPSSVAPATPPTGHGLVVSASAIASEAGAEVLRGGGNAVDAAIATGLALAVTYPAAGNIGGGGFMVIRFLDGRTTAFDFRERAPQAAYATMFLDTAGEYSSRIHHYSHLAVGVPGTVAGFALAHERYGTAEWKSLVQPAVALARDGFDLPLGLTRSLAGSLGAFEAYPATVAAFSKDGQPYAEGERFRQPDLARTLERIRDHGRDGFYLGETAALLAAEMRRGGGIITEADLAAYEAKERVPIHGTYRGYDLYSMPPPSSGGVALVQMLNILEGFDLASLGHNTPAYIHHLAEAMRLAFRDRARHLADPAFADVPVLRLTSKEYAAELRSTIDTRRAAASSPSDTTLVHESPETTHYSVVDGDGMAVSVTYTLEAGYGSRIVVPGAGFLLNNEMGDFNPRAGLTTETGLIGTEPNLVRPRQRMLSSMTPTILARDGRLVAVFGSPGGRTIINTVLQMALNLIDFEMTIEDAVASPRLHHQWLPDRISIEAGGITEAGQAALQTMGHTVRAGGRQGAVHAILIDPRTGTPIGAPDPRDPDAGAAGEASRARDR
ncbi:MAG TPA: gamma-glutamyltransferase [Thermoanaerobaculia bacterium]|nr:gamma-glutamyltransferase [Thermoanaerobaculia bacterium]